MWSGFFERIDLYLAPHSALLAWRGTVQVVSSKVPEAETTVLSLLQRCAAVVKSTGVRTSPKPRVRIMLSAALCPAFALHWPEGVRTSAEKIAFMQHSAKSALGEEFDAGTSSLDLNGHPIAGAARKGMLQNISEWANEHRFRITSIKPAWCEAVSCALARKTLTTCCLIIEPDAYTVLHLSANVKPEVFTVFLDNHQIDQDLTAFHRWKSGSNLDDNSLLQLRFGHEAGPQPKGGPLFFHEYWQQT